MRSMTPSEQTPIAVNEDLARFLPLRWALHCFICDGPQWDIEAWREYLLSENYPTDIPALLNNERLLHHVVAFLVARKVKTPEDLWQLLQDCETEYDNARAQKST